MANKNLLVRGGADFSALKKAMDRAQQQIKSFKDSVSSSMQSINVALAGIGAGLGIGMAVNDAMKFQASIQQLNRLMGNSAVEFQKWANTSAAAFNMSKSEAVQYGATFANIISTFAQNSQQTQQYTQDLLKATAVAASMTGRTMDDALERIRSGMLGNTEAVEDLGIFVNVAMIESTKAFQQFAGSKSWEQLDFRTQQTIRYFAILEQAATKYGVEVGNNAISATAQFTAQLKNLRLAIGEAFLPIWETVLPSLTAFIGWLVKGMTAVSQFMQVLFGKEPSKAAQGQADANTQVASSVDGIGDAYKKAGKEAKKAQGSLAGFDEVNSLADKSSATGADSGSSGGGLAGGGSAIPEVPTGTEGGISAISEKIKSLATNVRDFFSGVRDFFVSLGGFISNNRDIIIAALGGIAAGLLTYVIATKGATIATTIWNVVAGTSTKVMKGLRAAWAFLTGPIGLIVLAVAAAVAAFIYFYRTNDKFKGVVDGILDKIKDAAVYLWKSVLVPMGEFLGKVFVAAWEVLKAAAESFYKNTLIPLGDFLKTFWNLILVPLGKFLGDVFKEKWESISATLKFLLDKVLTPLAGFVKDVLIKAFDTWTKGMGEGIEGAKKALEGIVKFISGVFKGDWEKAWEGIKEVFTGVFKGIEAVVKTPLNIIIDAVNTLIDGLNGINIKIPDWVPGEYGGKSFGININKIPHLAKGGITNGPTLAMIGDNPGGQEVVSPLDDLTDMIASAVGTAVMSAMQFNGSNKNSGQVNLIVDGTTIARVLGPYLEKENHRIGGNMIKTT